MKIKKAVFGQAIHIGSKTYTSLNTTLEPNISMLWTDGYLKITFIGNPEPVIVFPTNISYMIGHNEEPKGQLIEEQVSKTAKRSRSMA